MRIGFGVDSHRLTEGRKLILGGVDIPYEKGLLGHSDADVLTHSVIDAVLGACALGDIGTHFPDTDAKYKDISSIVLLKKTADIIKKHGFNIENIDATVIIEKPKLAPYSSDMRKNIADALGISVERVSVKAKTNEKMGEIGSGNAAQAMCVALITTNGEE